MQNQSWACALVTVDCVLSALPFCYHSVSTNNPERETATAVEKILISVACQNLSGFLAIKRASIDCYREQMNPVIYQDGEYAGDNAVFGVRKMKQLIMKANGSGISSWWITPEVTYSVALYNEWQMSSHVWGMRKTACEDSCEGIRVQYHCHKALQRFWNWKIGLCPLTVHPFPRNGETESVIFKLVLFINLNLNDFKDGRQPQNLSLNSMDCLISLLSW